MSTHKNVPTAHDTSTLRVDQNPKFEIINIELNNQTQIDIQRSAVDAQGHNTAEFSVQLSSPLHIKKNSSVMLTDAYLSLFNNQPIQQGNIIIEQDYNFTMQFAFIWVNTLDQLDPAPNLYGVPLGFQSILVNQQTGQPILQDINISIKAGTYTCAGLVEIFNKQTSYAEYLNNANGGIIQSPPLNNNPLVYGNSLQFSLIKQFYNVTAFNLYTQTISAQPDPNYGYQITATKFNDNVYSIDNADQIVIYGSNGFLLNFDDVTQKFSIQSNFMPLINQDNQAFSILRYNDPTTAGQRDFIDRTAEVLVQRWGYTIQDWKTSFWYRLGFEASDLMKTDINDKFMFGRTFANANNLAINQTLPNDAFASNTMQTLKLSQSVILTNSTDQYIYNVTTYDGSTIQNVATRSPILIPLSYCRARLNLQILGGGRDTNNLYGFTQPISLLNISDSGITSFSILNPVVYMCASDYTITSIDIILQDPRTNKPLTWISKEMMTSLFLRIEQPF